MRPLSYQRDHLAWQQRVGKERVALTDFVRTFGSTRLPAAHLLDFKDFFPLRKPLSITSTPTQWGFKRTPESFGSTILGKRLREVRGKYARPVQEGNGLFRLRCSTADNRSQSVLKRPLVGAAEKKQTCSAGTSPRKSRSQAYIDQLRTELQAERVKRVAAESRISALS